jgi:hypothetical protein
MNTDSINVSVESVRRLARLAPLGGALVLLYLSLGAFCAYDAFLEYNFNIVRQPDRIPYLIVIYASFELLFILSAFRTWQATTLLHRLRTQPTGPGLIAALARVRDMLLLFFVWLIFWVCSYYWFAFRPVS